MWNGTDTPLGCLITFRCYGTWLHGDSRGSIERYHNRHGSPYIAPNETWHNQNQQRRLHPEMILDSAQRKAVEAAIREVCTYRNWGLLAIQVRTNHVHIVVSTGELNGGKVLNDFKAYATRQMRKEGCWNYEHSPWSDKGSCRYLWNERSMDQVIDYVVNGQGGSLSDGTAL